MTNIPQVRASLWGRFRFAVVGTLLSSPPLRGQLKAAIRDLAAKPWTHPVTGRDVHFAAVTIERWYYTARRAQDDPVGVLRRAVRKDCGKVSLPTAVAERLSRQYHEHPHNADSRIMPHRTPATCKSPGNATRQIGIITALRGRRATS